MRIYFETLGCPKNFNDSQVAQGILETKGHEIAASPEDAAIRVQQLMEEGLSRKDAVKQTAKELNLPKNVVYDAALK